MINYSPNKNFKVVNSPLGNHAGKQNILERILWNILNVEKVIRKWSGFYFIY